MFSTIKYIKLNDSIMLQGLKAAERNELLNIFRPRNPTGSFVTSTAALSSLKQYTSLIKKNLISNSSYN